MTRTKPIHIPLSLVSFTSKLDFIKHSYRICPDTHTRKNSTLWLSHIDALNEMRYNYYDLQAPSRWKKPRVVFFNPNVDLFHSTIPTFVLQGVLQTMASNPQHTFFLSTIFTERMAGMTGVLPWKPNIWMGVRINDGEITATLKNLQECGALKRYIILETVFSPLQLGWLKKYRLGFFGYG